MTKDGTRAGDGAAEEGEIRDKKRGDRGKRSRRMDDASGSSDDSESSSPEDERGSSRRKKERESDRDCRWKKRERDNRRSRGSSKRKRRSRRGGGLGTEFEEEDSYSSSSSGSETESDSESRTGTESDGERERSAESEGEARRRRKERRRKGEKERQRKKEKEKEKKRERRRREKERKRRKEKDKEKKRKKKEKDLGKTGAVTNNWGKYGIIREIDMWNKRPEFTAWLAEVKQVNMESLANWEEKQMFKEFMEDHNTATFPSRKYYDLDAYHCRKMSKQMRKGLKEAPKTERTVFDDEEQRRQELLKEREKMKEEQVEALKRSMQSGMAQAMKEQALLREEMLLQYKLGNFEAAAAIQRRLDPDVAM